MLSTLPDVIIAVVIILVLAASMSTLSSLVLTSASTLTLDVIMPFMKKDRDDQKKSLVIMRAFIVFFIAVSAAIAIIKDSFPGFTFIAQMMGVSWGALAGAFLAPFLYGLYSKKTTPAAVAVSFVYGVGIEVFQLIIMLTGMKLTGFLGFVFTNSLYSGVFAMVGGLILVPIVSAFTPKQKKGNVDYIFSCYDKKVLVPATDALHGEDAE